MTDQARKELEQKADKLAEDYVMREDTITENDRVPFDNGYGSQTVDFEKEVKKGYKDGYIAGAEGYEKQKEINKELVDDIAVLNKRIRELEKDKAYFSNNLDAEVEKKLEMQKEINELKKRIAEQNAEIERLAIEKRQAAEREAQDIRARFPQ